MQAHGFTIEQMAQMVRTGLETPLRPTLVGGGNKNDNGRLIQRRSRRRF